MPLTPITQHTATHVPHVSRDKENHSTARKSAPVRRRRARPAHGSIAASVSNPVVAAEHAAQKNARRGSTLASQVTITQPAEPAAQNDTSKPVISYNFPRHLPRLPIPRVKDEALAAVDKGLVDIPLEYLHHNLKGMQFQYVFSFSLFSAACC